MDLTELKRWTLQHLGQQVMFSSAGKTVLAGEWGGDTVAWSLASGREVMRLSRTMPLSINPAGTLVATSEGVVKIPSGEFAIERPRTSLYCETGPFSRDGSAVALPGRHNPDPNSPRQPNDWHSFMDVFNVGTGQFVARLTHGPHPIVSAQFTHDLRAFVTADGNSDAIVWELSTGRQEFKLPHAEGAWWIYVEPNGSRMMTVEPRTASAHLWNLLDQTNIRSFLHAQPDIPYDPAVWASDVSRDFKLLATAGYDQTVRIWNIDSGTEVSRCTHQSMYIDNVVFSPDGQLIATSARDETRDAGGKTWDTIRLFDASNGTELETMLFSTVKDLRFDSEGTCIAATGLDTEYVPNGSGEDPLPCAAVWLLSSGESTKRIAPPDSNKLEYEYDESSDRWTHKSC